MDQIDGNTSLTETYDANHVNAETIFSLPEDPQSSGNMNYNYLLNQENQTRRLLANAVKKPIEITYKSMQNISGINYATNVNVECNAGVYMTAIKPALELINVG